MASYATDRKYTTGLQAFFPVNVRYEVAWESNEDKA